MRAIQRGLLGVSQVTTDGLSRCKVSETSCVGGDSRPLPPLHPPPPQSLFHIVGDLFLVGAGWGGRMERVKTVWVGGAPTPAAGGCIMGVRRNEHRLGREPSKDQPETGSVHTLLATLTSSVF